MADVERLLRQIRITVFIIAGCVGSALLLGMTMLLWPEAREWLVEHRSAIAITICALVVVATAVGVVATFFRTITAPRTVDGDSSRRGG